LIVVYEIPQKALFIHFPFINQGDTTFQLLGDITRDVATGFPDGRSDVTLRNKAAEMVHNKTIREV
jgi:hypothetical protein